MSVASRRLWWAALVVCAVTLAGIVIGELTIGLPRVRSRRNMVIGPAGAAVWIIAGLISWRVRPDSRVGPLMVLIGWLHPAEPLLGGLGGAYVQWVLWIVLPIATLINQLALSFPTGRLTRPARIVVGLAWAGWFVGAFASALAVSSERCPACPTNPFPFADQGWSDRIYGVQEPLAIVAWSLSAVLLALRWRAASAPGRRALNPMLWGTMQYAILTVLLVPLGFGLGDGRPDKPAFWSFALIPVGVLIGMLHTRQHRSVVADLVVKLDRPPEPAALRGLLARALGDPSLELAFWLPDRQRYVDADGAPVEMPTSNDADRKVSVLQQGDEPPAALVYDPALLEDPKLLGAVTAAARMTLENSRLQAELRARLHEIRESRVRLVNATDAERRRIERNLHDGAQQTLLGLRLAVRLARNQAGTDPAALDALLAEIDGELQGAVEELRTLARGVHPPILSDEGLEPALAELARRAAIPTRVTCHCDGRLSPAVETAAYSWRPKRSRTCSSTRKHREPRSPCLARTGSR